MKWIWIILALVYLISPYDIISGMHLPGWLDDIVVLGLLFRYLMRLRDVGTAGQSSDAGNPHTRQQSPSHDADPDGHRKRSPHDILGVSTGADQQEIRAAYRKLVNQYHPDKVAHLGDEFLTLAEQRFKEIQKAYDELKRP